MDSTTGADHDCFVIFCHLLLCMNAPVGFCVPGKLLLLGTRKVHPSPTAGLMVPCVLCSPKGHMARLVGMAWVAAIPGASMSTEGSGHQSHCYSKVWAPHCLPQHKPLSCKCSVTLAQMSLVHLWWQHDPRLVQLIWVLLSCGRFSPLLQASRKQELGTPPLFVSCPPTLTPPQWGGVSTAFSCAERPSIFVQGFGKCCWKLGNDALMKGQQGWYLRQQLESGLPAAVLSLCYWGQQLWQRDCGHFPLLLSRAR